MKQQADNYVRIRPPKEMLELNGPLFRRDVELEAFVRNEFCGRGGLFWDMEHAHLNQAIIGVLWARLPATKNNRTLVGQAELLRSGDGTTWGQQRSRDYLLDLFPEGLPVFLHTYFARWCQQASDRAFFGLIDHELSHCAVAKDRCGAPRFSDRTGLPIWAKRGHDVETFVGTTERWGAKDTGSAELIWAGLKRPRFDWIPGEPFEASSCATCGR